MTLAHFIYIPGVLLFGIVVGYILGGRAAQMSKAEADDKAQRRSAREAARRARDRAAAAASPRTEE
ncbi:hypothetical protein [Paraliomyxa miuraensis]|uniref:hypothetical protein n=1 Tax=Paraliomyxa miuraensis TaxID=376150 RepID=UPI00225BB02D|nr:hypothetical protein [Paraliomyxa miuraensis]MCX4239842.1 hypothetical protein [Paraliomyxa miuraensis]